jgi:hypothetical protein
MTVSSTTVKKSYNGNGSTAGFTYDFLINSTAELKVIIRSSTGTETVKSLNSHYNISDSVGSGTVTFTAGNIPANGETIILIRDTNLTQGTDYVENDPFPSASHESALDKLTLQIQEVQEELNRAIKLSRTNTMTSTEFTVGSSDRASKILAFDSSGEISVTQELGTYKGTDTTTTTAAYSIRDIVKSSTAGQLNNVYICTAASVIGDTLTDTDHFALLVDAYTAASSATAAAASAADALSSANDAAADLVLTNADVVSTNADVVSTNADVLLTNADVVSTNADVVSTNADVVLTNADAAATAADLIATNQDTIDTAADLVATNQDTLDTAADLVLTNADVVLTHADVVLTAADAAATALDKIATNADVVLTGADVISAAASASAAAASADAFDDVYLGSKSSDPTTDNDGDPLAAGMLYFNTVSNVVKFYNGSAWVAISADTDSLVKVSSNDTTAGFLNGKIVAGTGISLTENNNGSNETLTITSSGATLDDATALSIALG